MKQSKGKDVTKSAQLSVRIPSMTRHALDYWEPIEKLNDTTFTEKAVDMYATFLSLDPAGRAAVLKAMKTQQRDDRWRRIFHSHPGVRWLRMYQLDDFPLDDEHARIRDFVLQHQPFFYEERGGELFVNVPFVETLWDPKRRVDAFMRLSSSDYRAPGKAMAAALDARGLEAPTWPPKARR